MNSKNQHCICWKERRKGGETDQYSRFIYNVVVVAVVAKMVSGETVGWVCGCGWAVEGKP